MEQKVVKMFLLCNLWNKWKIHPAVLVFITNKVDLKCISIWEIYE